jgi:FAD/FMN-containing dehydrogenase
MTTTYSQSKAAFSDLAALLTGKLFLPEDAAYEQVRQLRNGKVKARPAAIARCLTVQDVTHTICWTRTHELGLSVRGAEHKIFGRSLLENGVVIDPIWAEWHWFEPVAMVYPRATYKRLVALKNQYDPTNLFHLNQNIKPTVAEATLAASVSS